MLFAVLMIISILAISASASTTDGYFVDVGSPESVAKLTPGTILPRADDYNVAADKWFEYFGGFRRGQEDGLMSLENQT